MLVLWKTKPRPVALVGPAQFLAVLNIAYTHRTVLYQDACAVRDIYPTGIVPGDQSNTWP